MYLRLIKDGEGRVWGGLDRQDDSLWFCPSSNQWSRYKDTPGPRVPYEPWRRALVAYSRGKLEYDWLTTEKTIRSWLNVFEEYVVSNAHSN